ncbi:MAG: DUF4174 domain-containing protein [Akkermansiaceae bacterium]
MRKFLFLILSIAGTCAFLCPSISQASSLDKHLWKHRVLIIYAENDYSEEFLKFNKNITDRHLIYYQIKTNGKTISNNPIPLTNTQLKAINNQYHKKDSKQNKPNTTIILIGKDGKLKKRWDKLDFKAIFALIDTMPMRQREMQSQKK